MRGNRPDDRYQMTTVPGGFDVTCAECGESLQVRAGQARGQLVHDDDCPARDEIEEVIKQIKLLDVTTIQ